MKVKFGPGKTEHGPGILIELTGDEVAIAIDAYLVAQRVHIVGSRAVRVNGELCERGRVYVDPDGYVYHDGIKYSGSGRDFARSPVNND